MICKKCNVDSGTVLLRKKDYYCEKCFIYNINHKFRASIGKNKLFTSQENVLICLSGDQGSTVLLDLIYNRLSLQSYKKLRIRPHFLHLYDGNDDIAEKIIKECKNHDFVVYIVHISDYMVMTSNLPEPNSLPNLSAKTYIDLFKNVQPTAFNDMLIKVKRTLFIKYAKLLQCNFIFTGETTTSLAIRLLSSIALGRGSQVEDDIGFIDNRDDVKIIKPMKDISKEELEYYIKIKSLNIKFYNNMKKNSLQFLISSFVSDLQENFPSTISTVCKTADKLGITTDKFDTNVHSTCEICKSDLSVPDDKLTALQATEFSRLVSLQRPSNIETRDKQVINVIQENQNSMFPYINKHLCYSCSRNYSEINECSFKEHMDKLMSSN